GAAASQDEEEEDLGLGGLSGKQLRELQDLTHRAPEKEPLLPRTPLLVRFLPQAGRPSASPTKFSGRCTSSSLLLDHLHLLSVPPLVVVRYNVVFRYLLSVRRVQSQLQHCWALQMQRKHLKSSQSDAVKWRLRNHMAFLIDNLQYYLQVDVLESQFSQLLQQINSTRDFESIRLAHDHFLSNLLAQSFILLKPVELLTQLLKLVLSVYNTVCLQVFHCLNEILELCQSFCSLVGQSVASLDERGTAQQLDLLVKVNPAL
ncbi:Gamma-tubulin complex component 4, partial [Goodea atripinnis]